MARPAAGPPAAREGWVRLAPAGALPPGGAVRVDVDGHAVALFHTAAGLRAVDEHCLHAAGPLSQGAVRGGAVTCPWHAWCYDLATGARLDRRGQALRTYPVRLHGGAIFLKVAVEKDVPVETGRQG